MISKSQISFVNSLHQKKIRKQEQLFVAEGEKVVSDLLASSFEVKKVFATESFFEKHHSWKNKSSAEWIPVTDAELKKISFLTTPNEVLAIAVIPGTKLDESEVAGGLTFVLDDVSDPGNLGSIIRIADWFGIRNIICSPETADSYNPKVVQAAMGSLFRVHVHYTQLEEFFDKNSKEMKLPVYGMMLHGENLYSTQLSSAGLIVLGSESAGVNDMFKKYFTNSLLIPPYTDGKKSPGPDSLNVAVSAAIVCAEFRRRNQA